MLQAIAIPRRSYKKNLEEAQQQFESKFLSWDQGFSWSFLLQYDTIGKIELIPSIVLSSDNTKYKNDIQLFLQLFDELSVYRDYH